MKERLEVQMLQTITMDASDVHWVEAGREISIDGRMFDIKSITYHNGSITFSGLYDDDETSLINLLNRLQGETSGGDNELLSELFACMQTVYCLSQPYASIFHLGNQYELDMRFLPLPRQFTRIPVPPPQA